MDSYLTYHEFISYSQCFQSVHTLFRNHRFIHTLLIIPSNLHSLLTIGIHTLFTIQISYLIEQPQHNHTSAPIAQLAAHLTFFI